MADDREDEGAPKETDQVSDEVSATPLIDDLTAPVLFVDNVRGLQVRHSVLTLNLTNTLYGAPGSDHEGRHERMVCRLAMSLETFVQFAGMLERVHKQLIDDRIVEPVDPPPETEQ